MLSDSIHSRRIMHFNKRNSDGNPSKSSPGKQQPTSHPNPPIRVVRGNTEKKSGFSYPGSPSPRPQKKD